MLFISPSPRFYSANEYMPTFIERNANQIRASCLRAIVYIIRQIQSQKTTGSRSQKSKGTCIGIVCPIFNAVEELPGLDALPHLYQQQLHISVQNRIYMYRKMHQLVHTKFYWTLIMSAITILGVSISEVCTENVKFHPYPTPAYSPKRFRQTNPPLKFGQIAPIELNAL